jgi:hypothetical protein
MKEYYTGNILNMQTTGQGFETEFCYIIFKFIYELHPSQHRF